MALADWQRDLLSYWWKDITDEDIKLIEELYGMKRPEGNANSEEASSEPDGSSVRRSQ